MPPDATERCDAQAFSRFRLRFGRGAQPIDRHGAEECGDPASGSGKPGGRQAEYFGHTAETQDDTELSRRDRGRNGRNGVLILKTSRETRFCQSSESAIILVTLFRLGVPDRYLKMERLNHRILS
jgi:hypothetical protein